MSLKVWVRVSLPRMLDLGRLFLCEAKFSESTGFILQWFLFQGALISLCDDDYVHLWNLRQAQPALVQSLRFNREKWVWLLYFSNTYKLLQSSKNGQLLPKIRWDIIARILFIYFKLKYSQSWQSKSTL